MIRDLAKRDCAFPGILVYNSPYAGQKIFNN